MKKEIRAVGGTGRLSGRSATLTAQFTGNQGATGRRHSFPLKSLLRHLRPARPCAIARLDRSRGRASRNFTAIEIAIHSRLPDNGPFGLNRGGNLSIALRTCRGWRASGTFSCPTTFRWPRRFRTICDSPAGGSRGLPWNPSVVPFVSLSSDCCRLQFQVPRGWSR